MYPDLLKHVQCPICRGRLEVLEVTSTYGDGRIYGGTVRCQICFVRCPITEGILDLLPLGAYNLNPAN